MARRPGLEFDGEFHRLVIVGAGLSGLAAACTLQKHGLDAVVVDKNASRDDAGNGGLIYLQPDSGLWALGEAGLETQATALCQPLEAQMRILGRDGNVPDGAPSPVSGWAMDGVSLRDLLIDALAPETIRWNHELIAIEPTDQRGCHMLRFGNGETILAGVVVGADGAQSLIRSLVSAARPPASGMALIEFAIEQAEREHPDLARFVGSGRIIAAADGKAILAEALNSGAIKVCVFLPTPETGHMPDTTRAGVVACFQGWAPELIGLVEACDGDFAARTVVAAPALMTWLPQTSIALVGDAAHCCVLPFDTAANLALQEGVEFVLDLIATHDPAPALAAYEARVFARAGRIGAQATAELEALGDGALPFSQALAARGPLRGGGAAGAGSAIPALTLEERIGRLEDIEAIKDLTARYAFHINKGWNGKTVDVEAMPAIFARDACWESKAMKLRAQGLDQIMATLETATEHTDFSMHSYTNPIIEIAGDRATGNWLFWIASERDGDSINAVFMSEDIAYVQTPDGWRIEAVDVHYGRTLR